MIGRTRSVLGRVRRSLSAAHAARAVRVATSRALTPPPPSAFARFGRGSALVPPARVDGAERIEVGDRVLVHELCWLMTVPIPGARAPRLVIGDGTRINRFFKAVCAGELRIGRDCLIGDHVFIADTHHRWDDPGRPVGEQPLAAPRPVIIGDGVHVGFGAIIRPGVRIGDGAYIGAGAVVTEDVATRSVVVGNPARVIRRYDEAAGTWRRVDR